MYQSFLQLGLKPVMTYNSSEITEMNLPHTPFNSWRLMQDKYQPHLSPHPSQTSPPNGTALLHSDPNGYESPKTSCMMEGHIYRSPGMPIKHFPAIQSPHPPQDPGVVPQYQPFAKPNRGGMNITTTTGEWHKMATKICFVYLISPSS